MAVTKNKEIIPHSFIPILCLETDMPSLVTPFNFLPFEMAYQCYKLQVLSSIPFGLFRPIEDDQRTNIIEFTNSLISRQAVKNHLRVCRRPVILWISDSSPKSVMEIVQIIHANHAMCCLIITEHPAVEDYISKATSGVELTSVIYLHELGDNEIDDRPLIIWKAFLELCVRIDKMLPPGMLRFNIPPDRSKTYKFHEVLEFASSGDITAATIGTAAVPLYNDFIYYPNAIIVNLARYKIGSWIRSVVPDLIKENVYAYAQEIKQRKTMSIVTDDIIATRLISESGKKSSRKLSGFLEVLPAKTSSLLRKVATGVKYTQEMRNVFIDLYVDYAQEGLKDIVMPHIILVCQSFPFSYDESTAIATGMAGNPCSYLQDDALYETYFGQLIAGGRNVPFDTPDDAPEHVVAIKKLGGLSVLENNFISAISVFYAARRQCPVFKTFRVGQSIFGLFHKMDLLISHRNYEHEDQGENKTGKGLELETTMNEISTQSSALIDERIMDEIFACLGDPVVFMLSDIPLDFVRTRSDYFGYKAVLSRLPLTPGSLPVQYYNSSESFTNFENAISQVVVVTSFAKGSRERIALEAAISAFRYPDPVSIVDVNTRFELINYVNNNHDIKCLIFFGHGGIDRKHNTSWLQLTKENFYNSDIRRFKHFPKTIVLIGCNTSSGGSTMSGMDIPFLERGCQVVATTFPIPLILGATFLGMFLSNFLSPGVIMQQGVRHYADLSDILTVVKRRLRINSILLNLMEQGKIGIDGAEDLLEKYGSVFERLERERKGHDDNPSLAIKILLLKENLIDSMDVPFYDFEKIPYCLFFTCLGYAWHNKNKNISR
jgi:hypothetical protein